MKIEIEATLVTCAIELHYVKPGQQLLLVGNTIVGRHEPLKLLEVNAKPPELCDEEVAKALLEIGPVSRRYLGDHLGISRSDMDTRTDLRQLLERGEKRGLYESVKIKGKGIIWASKNAMP